MSDKLVRLLVLSSAALAVGLSMIVATYNPPSNPFTGGVMALLGLAGMAYVVYRKNRRGDDQ